MWVINNESYSLKINSKELRGLAKRDVDNGSTDFYLRSRAHVSKISLRTKTWDWSAETAWYVLVNSDWIFLNLSLSLDPVYLHRAPIQGWRSILKSNRIIAYESYDMIQVKFQNHMVCQILWFDLVPFQTWWRQNMIT